MESLDALAGRVRAGDIVDAMGRRHRHRCHLLDLVGPTLGRRLFGPAVTISYFPASAREEWQRAWAGVDRVGRVDSSARGQESASHIHLLDDLHPGELPSGMRTSHPLRTDSGR
jgi:hypothetical protein